MKKSVILILFLVAILSCNNLFSQIYIITEKFDGSTSAPPTFDSVFVTNPSGTTTSYKIPNFVKSPASHDSQFSTILNNIVNQGYKVLYHYEAQGVVNAAYSPSTFVMRTIFLAKP
jgi:hypothetical protein